MKKAQQKRTDSLYRKHLSALKRQGKAESTIDVYSRAVRRLTEYFDCPPDILTVEQLEGYFGIPGCHSSTRKHKKKSQYSIHSMPVGNAFPLIEVESTSVGIVVQRRPQPSTYRP